MPAPVGRIKWKLKPDLAPLFYAVGKLWVAKHVPGIPKLVSSTRLSDHPQQVQSLHVDWRMDSSLALFPSWRLWTWSVSSQARSQLSNETFIVLTSQQMHSLKNSEFLITPLKLLDTYMGSEGHLGVAQFQSPLQTLKEQKTLRTTC